MVLRSAPCVRISPKPVYRQLNNQTATSTSPGHVSSSAMTFSTLMVATDWPPFVLLSMGSAGRMANGPQLWGFRS